MSNERPEDAITQQAHSSMAAFLVRRRAFNLFTRLHSLVVIGRPKHPNPILSLFQNQSPSKLTVLCRLGLEVAHLKRQKEHQPVPPVGISKEVNDLDTFLENGLVIPLEQWALLNSNAKCTQVDVSKVCYEVTRIYSFKRKYSVSRNGLGNASELAHYYLGTVGLVPVEMSRKEYLQDLGKWLA